MTSGLSVHLPPHYTHSLITRHFRHQHAQCQCAIQTTQPLCLQAQGQACRPVTQHFVASEASAVNPSVSEASALNLTDNGSQLEGN